jgi:hypothetical protein
VSGYPPPDLLTALDDPLGSCDWGDCDETAVTTRYDDVSRAWVPVCDEHRRDD